MADIKDLNGEQREIAALMVDGLNIFYTGNAGTGKTMLLRMIISLLRQKHGNDCVGVTATTGIAAIQIGDGGRKQSIHGQVSGLVKDRDTSFCSKSLQTLKHMNAGQSAKHL